MDPIRNPDSGADGMSPADDDTLGTGWETQPAGDYAAMGAAAYPDAGYREPPANHGLGILDNPDDGTEDDDPEYDRPDYAGPAHDGPAYDGPVLDGTVYPPSGHTGAGAEPPTAVVPAEPATLTLKPVGAEWNQPVSVQPQAAEAAGSERNTGPFGVIVTPGENGAPARLAQPRTLFRDLPPDVQRHFWRIRAVIAVVVFIAFFVLANWVVALTLSILAIIADTVYRNRTAGSITTGRASDKARRRTARQLAGMRRSGYHTLNARPIPDSRESIDHLVVGPTGVYAIDSEKWHKSLPVRTWNGKKLYHGPDSKKDRLVHAAWEAQQASDLLTAALGVQIPVQPALAIYGPRIPWDIATIRNVDVFSGPALSKYLRRRKRLRERPRYTSEQVRTIYDTARQVLPDVVPVAPARPSTPVG